VASEQLGSGWLLPTYVIIGFDTDKDATWFDAALTTIVSKLKFVPEASRYNAVFVDLDVGPVMIEVVFFMSKPAREADLTKEIEISYPVAGSMPGTSEPATDDNKP
jgi:hypothetical protein